VTGPPHYIEGGSLSATWVQAVEAILARPRRDAFHFFVRALEPLPEIAGIRMQADELMEAIGKQSIDTVRNTIFPYEWAQDIPDPAELCDDYLKHYEDLKDLGSPRGTYFGRMIAHPRSDATVGNQLLKTIEKLNAARSGQRWTSRYEISIYSEYKDAGITRSFPCMSHLAFHVEGEELHCLATYRNHDLIDRSYGNWLGLAQLQGYLATTTGFVPGELAVAAGHAFVDLFGTQLARLREMHEAVREHA
jgi:thymidylate synthase